MALLPLPLPPLPWTSPDRPQVSRNLRPKGPWRHAPLGAGAPLTEPRMRSNGSRATGTVQLSERCGPRFPCFWEASRLWPGSPSAGRPWLLGGSRRVGPGCASCIGLQIRSCQDSRPPGEVLELVWLGGHCWPGLSLGEWLAPLPPAVLEVRGRRYVT